MVKKLAAVIALGLFTNQMTHAQDLDGLFNKVKKGAKSLSKSLSWEPGKAVSTSLKDTLTGVYWMDEYLAHRTADTISSFSLKPGYYKTTLRSYCLHAGTYGPSKGSGYQVANFEGSQKKLITSILEKSVEHPDISQSDVQTLIWGIEAGTKFSAYPTDFQVRVKPLISVKDMALMEINVKNIVEKNLPSDVKSLLNTYASLRNEMQSAQMNFAKLEDLAVKTGVPAIGVGSVTIDPGKWSYLESGYFMKVNPQSYSTTDVTLYRPLEATVAYDSQNRISSYSHEGYKVTVNYKDAGKPIEIGEYKGHVQQIESYTLESPGMETQTVESNQKYFDFTLDAINQYIESGKVYDFDGSVLNSNEISFKEAKDSFQKLKNVYDRTKDLMDIYDDFNIDENPPENLDKYLSEAYQNERVNEAIQVATNPIDKKGQSKWLKEHFQMLNDFFFYSICKLRGDDCKPDNDPKNPKLPDYIGQPGNTNAQRIGLSEYKK